MSTEPDDNDYEVKEVTGVRLQKSVIQFKVIWKTDNSESWEPIKNFANQLENERIQDFKTRHPDKWERVMKGKIGHGKWEFELQVDADRYEKPDEAAAGEARRLADPNRLEDAGEKFLKNYMDGIPGRLSRSKTRDILRNIASSPTKQQPSPKKTTEKKKRGGKKKKNDEESTSRPKSPSEERQAKEEKSADTAAVPTGEKEAVEKVVEEKIDDEAMKTVTKTVDCYRKGSYKKKKRLRKLNSSSEDSSDDGELHTELKRSVQTKKSSSCSVAVAGRIGGGGNGSPTPLEQEATSWSAAPIEKRTSAAVDLDKQEKQFNKNDRKRQNKEEAEPQIRKVEDRYVDVERNTREIEMEFAEFGIVIAKENPKNRLSSEFEIRKAKMLEANPTITLDDAIKALNSEITEIRLIEMGPTRALNELLQSKALHEILTHTYGQKKRSVVSEEVVQERRNKTEKLIRAALAYLPAEILIDQDDSLNTLLHCAINSENPSLVEFLIKMGSPLHIRNRFEMTAVESCLVLHNAHILNIVIRNGGTFHHLLSKSRFPQSDHQELLKFLERLEDKRLLQMTAETNVKIQQACDKVRKQQIAGRIYEHEYGPIVSFPRSNINGCGLRQIIQFMIPESWVNQTDAKFMLAIIPMAFNNKRKYFCGSSHKLPTRSVHLCGTPCKPMTNDGVLYQATAAVHRHFSEVQNNPPKTSAEVIDLLRVPTLEEREKVIKNRLTTQIHPRLCTIALEFEPSAVFSFVTSQLILYSPNSGNHSTRDLPRDLVGRTTTSGGIRPGTNNQGSSNNQSFSASASSHPGVSFRSGQTGHREHQYDKQRLTNNLSNSMTSTKPFTSR